MKITKLLTLSVTLLSLSLVSCDNEDKWSKFELVELDAKGIATTLNNRVYKAEIPAEGATFTTKGIGERKDYAFVSKIGITEDKKYSMIETPMPPFKDNDLSVSGSWGSLKYSDINAPFEIEFTISPNSTAHERKIEINFGGAYYESTISIIQPPMALIIGTSN